MKYFDEYKYLAIGIDTVEDSTIFQQLLFDNEITWSGNKNFYVDSDCVYLIRTEDKSQKGFISIQSFYNTKRSYNGLYNGKIYGIDDYDLIKNLIIHGTDLPSYKPKRIKREV